MWAGNSTPPAGLDGPTLQILLISGSSLSIAGSGFIILSYFLFPDSRKFSRKILLYLSLADVCASAAWVLQYVVPDGGDTLCFTQGYMLQFFYLASYLWTGCFAWHLYQLIDARNRTPKSLETLYHFLSWGIPLLICGYLFYRQRQGLPAIGPSKYGRPWCWIATAQDDTNQWMQFSFFYGPLMAVFLFNLLIYLWLCRRVRTLMSPLQHKIRRRLFLYLGVFIFLTGWGLANRIWQAVEPNHVPNAFLLYADALCGPMQGFGNAVVYGLNKRLRERYYQLCCSRCGEKNRRGSAEESLRAAGMGYGALDQNGNGSTTSWSKP